MAARVFELRVLLLLVAMVLATVQGARRDDQAGSCSRITNDDRFSQLSYTPPTDNRRVPHRTKVHFTCAQDFVRLTRTPATCKNGIWKPDEPNCEPVFAQCTAPDLPARIGLERGSLRPGVDKVYHNTRALAGCSQGYVHVEPGDKSYKPVQCIDGSWNRNTDCVSEPCYLNRTTEISGIDGADDQNNGLYKVAGGDTVILRCQFGHRVSAVCEGATFKPVNPSCQMTRSRVPTTCSSRPSIKHGSTDETRLSISGKVYYRCKRRYVMIGSDFVLCVRGHWSDAPSCVLSRDVCGDTSKFKHGTVHSSCEQTYICQDGTMSGHMRTC